jgi:tRNA(fMet)-specific endonuclease VapC
VKAAYMLDTNTVSHLLKGQAGVTQRIVAVPMAALCISSMTEAELLFGLAKRPEAKRLHCAVHEFLRRVAVLAWDSSVAACYGQVRAELEKEGKALSAMDLMIASHALATGAVLVTNDQAFSQVRGLNLEDWTV